MNPLLTAKGKWFVGDREMKIITDTDFIKFYLWLFRRGTYNIYKMNLPKYLAHIGIINEKIHNKDCSDYKYLNGREVWFKYDPSGNFGGYLKGFRNFWLDCFVEEGEEIQREFGIEDKTEGFARFHITIANNKNIK